MIPKSLINEKGPESVKKKAISKKSMTDFSGIISKKDYRSLKEYTEKARKECNRAI